MNDDREEVLRKVTFLTGDEEILRGMPALPALEPFSDSVLDLLNDVSKKLMSDREAKEYPDVVTFAFWIRKSSALKLKARFKDGRVEGLSGGGIRLGRGVAFHIAPSNVPVNFAYSLAVGLLTGNADIVRVPSKEFTQVRLISDAFKAVLQKDDNASLRGYICLVRYGREREVNDLFSSMADTRIIWGGDETIAEIRRSPLKPRANEVTFADRFSIAVIDSGTYLNIEDKRRAAEDFYNDTYLTDQNACTSPRIVVWTGERKEEAKKEFWENLREVVGRKYTLQPIQAVNKLVSGCLAAAVYAGRPEGGHGGAGGQSGETGAVKEHTGDGYRDSAGVALKGSSQTGGVVIRSCGDNRIVRVRVPELIEGLMDLKDNSGYFFEYDCEDIMELKGLCGDIRCQTIACIGKPEMLRPLLFSGVKGIDRVVPVGKTMDFDLEWDGYDLYERLTRIITVRDLRG